MTVEHPKRALHQALVDAILDGDGRTPPELRRQAFHHDRHLPEPLANLLAKVATAAPTVADADLAAVKGAGFSEDQVFELVICAAVGQATRQYQAGLAALDLAATNRERP